MRERAGLTQEELADRAGLTSHAVSALERGTRTRPYPHTVRALAAALDLSETEQQALIASVPRRRAADRSPVPPSTAPPPPPVAQLVVPPTQLYGRSGDLAALTGLLRSGRVRLVTLTGLGGVGKTRLVAAVAAELADDFPDGVVQVPLASVADPAAVLDTVRRALGISGADGPSTFDAVVAHLRSRRMLLVLDNLEHLLDAAADLGRLVASCPTLTVLTSSRAPLRVRGEHEYPVGPLALPSPDATTAAELAGAPAGALVLDRAEAVGAAAVVAPDAVQALARLCVRLAGIPLALELASARLRVLTLRELLERLDSVLDSDANARDLPTRQRTMRSTLDWSYRLLTPDQQQLFRVLAVFRGGATLDAVEQVVAAASDLAPGEVLDLLAQLVEQSMVLLRPGPEGTRRDTMLEPVAQYARTLLVGEPARAAGRAHAEVYRRLAREGASGIERADQVRWLDRIEAEEPNLLVAVERSLTDGDPDVGGRIVWKLWLYWWLRGQFSRGREQAERCLLEPLSPPVRARAILSAACMSYAGGDVAACTAYWHQALRLGEEQQDAEVICKSVPGTGLAALAAGDLVEAEARFRQALPLCTAAGEPESG